MIGLHAQLAAASSNEPSRRLIARVSSGRGLASGNLAGATRAIGRHLGDLPVPGSLNLVLRQPVAFDMKRALLSVEDRWHFWPVAVNGHACLAYRWNACPLHVIEVVSSRHLRSALGLADGARVAIELPRDALLPVPLPQQLIWGALWGWTGPMFYTSDTYARLARRPRRLWRLTTQASISC